MLALASIVGISISACAQGPAANQAGRLADSMETMAQQRIDAGGLSHWDEAVMKKALETGAISQADYEEGASLFMACMNDAGMNFTSRTHLNGVIEFVAPQRATSEEESAQQATAQAKCYESTFAATQELFRMQQANPDLLSNFPLATANCLKSAGVVSDDFTEKDFVEAIQPRDEGESAALLDFEDERVQTCLYSLGYSIGVAK